MHVIKTRNVYGCSIRKSCIISNHAVFSKCLRLSGAGGRLAARNLSTHCRKNRTKISKSRAKKELSNGIKIGNSVFYAGCPIFSYTYGHNYVYIIILGIRIRSEGLAQVMTKRNASEYIIGSIQRYPVPTRDTVIAGLSSGLARWACRSSVAHSSRVVACRGCRRVAL